MLNRNGDRVLHRNGLSHDKMCWWYSGVSLSIHTTFILTFLCACWLFNEETTKCYFGLKSKWTILTGPVHLAIYQEAPIVMFCNNYLIKTTLILDHRQKDVHVRHFSKFRLMKVKIRPPLLMKIHNTFKIMFLV